MEQASPPPSNTTIEQPGSRNKSRRLSQVDEGNILESRKRKRGQGDEEVSLFFLVSIQASLLAVSVALESLHMRGRGRGNNQTPHLVANSEQPFSTSNNTPEPP